MTLRVSQRHGRSAKSAHPRRDAVAHSMWRPFPALILHRTGGQEPRIFVPKTSSGTRAITANDAHVWRNVWKPTAGVMRAWSQAARIGLDCSDFSTAAEDCVSPPPLGGEGGLFQFRRRALDFLRGFRRGGLLDRAAQGARIADHVRDGRNALSHGGCLATNPLVAKKEWRVRLRRG